MKDPSYQNESRILLDIDEATVFLSHDDEGNRIKKRYPTNLMPHVIINDRIFYRVSDLRRV